MNCDTYSLIQSSECNITVSNSDIFKQLKTNEFYPNFREAISVFSSIWKSSVIYSRISSGVRSLDERGSSR